MIKESRPIKQICRTRYQWQMYLKRLKRQGVRADGFFDVSIKYINGVEYLCAKLSTKGVVVNDSKH